MCPIGHRRAALALSAALLFLAPSARAQVVPPHGTLAVSQGPHLLDYQIRAIVDANIPASNAHSTVIIFGQCFSGDNEDEWTGRPNTAVIMAGLPGEQSRYAAWHLGMALALRPGPGLTTAGVMAAAAPMKHPSESPHSIGPAIALDPVDPNGPIKSRHAIMYAGIPDTLPGRDLTTRETLIRNLDTGQNSSSTVTTVGSVPSPLFASGVWSYPGSVAGLTDAAKAVGAKMNTDEQFILFVADHGGLGDIDGDPLPENPQRSKSSRSMGLPPGGCVLQDPLLTREQLQAIFSGAIIPPSGVTFFLDGTNVGPGTVQPLDLNADGDTTDPDEGFVAFLDVDYNPATCPGVNLAVEYTSPDPPDQLVVSFTTPPLPPDEPAPAVRLFESFYPPDPLLTADLPFFAPALVHLLNLQSAAESAFSWFLDSLTETPLDEAVRVLRERYDAFVVPQRNGRAFAFKEGPGIDLRVPIGGFGEATPVGAEVVPVGGTPAVLLQNSGGMEAWGATLYGPPPTLLFEVGQDGIGALGELRGDLTKDRAFTVARVFHGGLWKLGARTAHADGQLDPIDLMVVPGTTSFQLAGGGSATIDDMRGFDVTINSAGDAFDFVLLALSGANWHLLKAQIMSTGGPPAFSEVVGPSTAGLPSPLTDLGFTPRADESNALFRATSATEEGVYLTDGITVTTVADTSTVIPGSATETFAWFADPLALDGMDAAFMGADSFDNLGVYAFQCGTLRKVVEVGDVLEGRVVADVLLGRDSLAAGSVGVMLQFTDGSRTPAVFTFPAPLDPSDQTPRDAFVDVELSADSAIVGGAPPAVFASDFGLAPLVTGFSSDGTTGMLDIPGAQVEGFLAATVAGLVPQAGTFGDWIISVDVASGDASGPLSGTLDPSSIPTGVFSQDVTTMGGPWSVPLGVLPGTTAGYDRILMGSVVDLFCSDQLSQLGGSACGLGPLGSGFVPAAPYDPTTGLVNMTGPTQAGTTVVLATGGDQRWSEGGNEAVLCGDTDGDGLRTQADIDVLRAALAGISGLDGTGFARCAVAGGPFECNIRTSALLTRVLGGQPNPALRQVCASLLP